jgi:hypothetical protein
MVVEIPVEGGGFLRPRASLPELLVLQLELDLVHAQLVDQAARVGLPIPPPLGLGLAADFLGPTMQRIIDTIHDRASWLRRFRVPFGGPDAA